ncbi:hypothetical protein [Aneurinibacillus migulanus]|uniref:Uncharacterized protein n=1 Tax=Aneurinibacillus migulanus TaxID=47500 RepID=A0A1G8ZZW3_ANEMI|nr:hypothetical protein [Aneurinibacillus migulanus]SDK20648.1 hypothetical protein SAMN04487909_14336 [Aneurinibacillus migulanus]
MEGGDSEKRRGWVCPALRQKKGQRVFFLPPTTTGYKQGFPSPFSSTYPGQAKEDRNCLPLRVYPDVLLSRLAGVKSGPLRFCAGDEPTPV